MPADELTPATGPSPIPVVEVLTDGDLEVEGRLPWSSNVNFVVTLTLGGQCLRAVYKPERGEQPLWDFPSGLHRREAAAWRLSDQLGWGIVPETVVRDGPYGEGSVQRFIDADHDHHYFTMRDHPRFHDTLQRICVFDAVSNQTDRKGGHCLLGLDGRIWAIDNALGFHADSKLRTVIWDWAGDEIPGPIVRDLERFVANGPDPALRTLLAPDEVVALVRRASAVIADPVFPTDTDARHPHPWPLI